MAQIRINEISQNYTYNIGTNSFATVALPITAAWGPALEDPVTLGKSIDEVLETVHWHRFPATQAGLEAFVSTYRGPSSNYRLAKDHSYHMALTLLTAGYDVLVCRLSPGTNAQCEFTQTSTNGSSGKLIVKAKYPGSFGNNLRVRLTKLPSKLPGQYCWSIVTYIIDDNKVQTAVENLRCVFDIANADDILHVSEVESNYISLAIEGTLSDSELASFDKAYFDLDGGSDVLSDKKENNQPYSAVELVEHALEFAKDRYTSKIIGGYPETDALNTEYLSKLSAMAKAEGHASIGDDRVKANTIKHREWLFTYACYAYDLLKDKLAYSPQRIISPGWDDQDVSYLTGNALKATVDDNETTILAAKKFVVSPMHIKLMDVGYHSRCGTALLDIPKSLPRSLVHSKSIDDATVPDPGYAEKLSRYHSEVKESLSTIVDENAVLYSTHSALFAPWGQYVYAGTSKQNPAPPAFLNLMIMRSMILNQSVQYEWALPTNRKHKVNTGKLDYTVSQKLLNCWQTLEGVGVNVITAIPDLGTTVWGNSTLFEVPPATYQALANLSTRYLVNAVEDVVYRCGISITFQYNNEQAYNKFYAGVTPILDTMKNVGAIDDYYVRMSADINGLDQVNANTVIGKVYLVINGVINDINVDLIALPPGTDLNQYKA